MGALTNFPIKNQLADTHEVNKDFDCVPTALAACLEYILGTPFDGAAIKDAVYGAGYQGGTAASQYVDYCKAHGAALAAIEGTPEHLIAAIRQRLAEAHPVLVTEPDPYANPSLGWSHVVAMCGCDETPGTLTALDPYGGHLVTLPDTEWQRRLEFHEVWTVEKENDMPITIDLHTPGVAPYFSAFQGNAQQWLCSKPGQDGKQKVVQFAILNWYRTNGYAPLCGLSCAGLPQSNEVPIERFSGYEHFAGSGIVVQFFERMVVCYDAKHQIDNPPGAGDVYPLHLYSDASPGTDPRLTLLKNQLAPVVPPAMLADMAQIKAIAGKY